MGAGRLGREAAWLALGQGLGALAGLVGVRLLTGITTREVYGLSWLFINGTGLALSALARPVGQTLSRYYYEAKDPERLDRLMALVWRLQIGTGLAVGVVYLAVVALLGSLEAEEWLAFAILPAYFFFLSFYATAEVFLNTARRRGRRVLLNVAEAVLRPAFAVCLCLLWEPGVNAFVLGYALSGLVTGSVGMGVLGSIGRRGPFSLPGPSRAEVREALAYALPWVGFAGCSWVLSLSDRYLIALLAGAEWTGTYVAAYQVAGAPFQFLGAVFTPLIQPVLFQNAASDGAGSGRSMSAAFRLFAWVSLPILAGFILMRGWLLRILVDPRYWGGLEALLWIGIALYLWVLGDVARNAFLIARRTGSILGIYVAAAVLNLGLNLVLIPRLGIVGAAIAAAASQGFYALSAILWSRRIIPWAIPAGSGVAASLVAIAAAGGGMLTHEALFSGRTDMTAGIGVAAVFCGLLVLGAAVFRASIREAAGGLSSLRA